MSLTQMLAERWAGREDGAFLIAGQSSFTVGDILAQDSSHLEEIQPGDVVALIGDFNVKAIADLIALIDRKAIVVPLTEQTRKDHDYFFRTAMVDWTVEVGRAEKRQHSDTHHLLGELRSYGNPGLVLFSTGTTGRPKAILHDMTAFLKRFATPRPTLRTMAFLLFDHIGGINTLLHTMFNMGVVVTPPVQRSVSGVLESCREHNVEALPTTPTFLRMMVMSGLVPDSVPECLKIITYGTERMDQSTLDFLCEMLPSVDFRQTFGMSELGILRVTSRSRNSLFMKVGGEGVETRVDSGVLKIRSATRMLGYLNAESPFDENGWYTTNDLVETDGEYIQVVGRTSEVINVGGLKFMASEVERVVMLYPGIAFVSVVPRTNPVTGQHVEIVVETDDKGPLDQQALRNYLVDRLPGHMVPRRITFSQVEVNHRFKRT